jgi:hypothetical protein
MSIRNTCSVVFASCTTACHKDAVQKAFDAEPNDGCRMREAFFKDLCQLTQTLIESNNIEKESRNLLNTFLFSAIPNKEKAFLQVEKNS